MNLEIDESLREPSLEALAKVAAVAHAPFISAASPQYLWGAAQFAFADVLAFWKQAGVVLGASSGIAAGIYHLFKACIEARNGRKFRVKIGDIEVEATQMPEEKFLRLVELVQEKANSDRIKKLLGQP